MSMFVMIYVGLVMQNVGCRWNRAKEPSLKIHWSTDLIKKSSMQKCSRHWYTTILALVTAPDMRIVCVGVDLYFGQMCCWWVLWKKRYCKLNTPKTNICLKQKNQAHVTINSKNLYPLSPLAANKRRAANGFSFGSSQFVLLTKWKFQVTLIYL